VLTWYGVRGDHFLRRATWRILPTIDVEDVETVIDVYIDRLLALQIGEGLPVYVVPRHPLARVLIP
jgi:hypothetical protein